MAKKDELLARIDADIARLKHIEGYAQTHGDNQALLVIINDEVVEFQKMRAYVTQDGTLEAAPKTRKARKSRAKPGLPATDDTSI